MMVAAGVEHEPVLRWKRYRTVIDVGANRGQFALAARRSCPDARIISFEPLLGAGEKFERVFGGDDLTDLIKAAVGPQRCRAEIHVSQRDDSSSLLPIGALQNQVFPGTKEIGTQLVEVGPLERFLSAEMLREPVILKIDVQGYERQTLEGCESLLDSLDTIYVECSFAELYEGQGLAGEIIDWLQFRGFALAGVHNVSYLPSGVAIQADFLFENRGRSV